MKVIPNTNVQIDFVEEVHSRYDETIYEVSLTELNDELENIDIGLTSLLKRYNRSRNLLQDKELHEKLLVSEQLPIIIDTSNTFNMKYLKHLQLHELKKSYLFSFAYLMSHVIGLLSIMNIVPNYFCVLSFIVISGFLILVIVFNCNITIAKVLMNRFEAGYLFFSFTSIAGIMIMIFTIMGKGFTGLYIFGCYLSWICMLLADSLTLKLKHRFITGNGIIFCVVFSVISYGLFFEWYEDIVLVLLTKQISLVNVCLSNIMHNYIFTIKNIVLLAINNSILPTFQTRKKYIKISKKKAEILVMASKFF